MSPGVYPQQPGHPYAPQAVPVAPVQHPAAPGQQPVVYLQPVQTQPVPVSAEDRPDDAREAGHPEVKIVSHSNIFYWWPVWAVGYAMALVTYLQGQSHQIGAVTELYHPSSSMGVVFFMTLFLVFLITNVSLRGVSSVIVILLAVLATVVLAWQGWWDVVLEFVGDLSIHMNLGAYTFISTLMALAWVLAICFFDRVTYWRIRPGQITQEYLLGAGSRSYDTHGMMMEKHRDDLFRHWVLGFGSGDLKLQTGGATRETFHIPNVLFLGSKVYTIQRMIATEPDAFGGATIT